LTGTLIWRECTNAFCVANMINIISIKNKLIYVYIIIMAFIPSPYFVTIVGVPINLDRLMFVVIAMVGMLSFLGAKSSSILVIQVFLWAYLGLVIANHLFLGNVQLMSIYVVSSLIALASKDIKVETFIRGVYVAFYGYAFWSIYSLVSFFTVGTLIELPFSAFLPNVFESELEHAAQLASSYSLFPRISFPFATPPMLAALGAAYFLFFRFLLELHNQTGRASYGISRKTTMVGMTLSLIILTSTVSKTGVAILAAGLVVNFILNISWVISKKNMVKFLIGLFLIPVCISMSLALIENNPIVEFITSRLFSSESDFDLSNPKGHLSIRVQGLNHFLGLDLLNQLFGIGYLNIAEIHYHSSFLTSLIETGLLGVSSFIAIVLYPAFKAIPVFLNTRWREHRIKAKYIIVSSATIFTAHVVYEMPYVHFLWFFWALTVSLATRDI